MAIVDTQHFIIVWNVNHSFENSAPMLMHPLSAIQPPNIPYKVRAIAALHIVYNATKLLFDWLRYFASAVYIIDPRSSLSENVFYAAAVIIDQLKDSTSAPSPTLTLTGSILANCCVASWFVLVVFCSLYSFGRTSTIFFLLYKKIIWHVIILLKHLW